MPTVDLLFQGFPGWSPTHGRLGWPSVALIRADGTNLLLDTGHMGMHRLLLGRLAEMGVPAESIDLLVLSHSHWDHSLGTPLFPGAQIVIGETELRWAVGLRPAENPSVPVYLMQHLADHPRLRTVRGDTDLLPGVAAIDPPGHTPGHISLVVATEEGRVVLAQDAVKNRGEFLARRADQTMDPAASSASIERIATLANTVIPGHDRAFRVAGNRAVYQGELRAEILAKTSPYAEEETLFTITLR